MKRLLGAVCALVLIIPTTATAGTGNATGRPGHAAAANLYRAEVSITTERALRAEGLDVATSHGTTNGERAVELVLSDAQAEELRRRGIGLGLVRNGKGETNAEAAFIEADNGYEVWRSWSEPGGIRDEMVHLADVHDGITELVTIGQSVQGQDILAMRVTKGADKVKRGARPAVLYNANHHAREWITVEVNRRNLRYVLENYGTDPQVTRLVDTREMWFVLSGNPDGYDYSFTEGNRLHRKNNRDTDGDPATFSIFEGVDLNRNFPTNWGLDNEGSSDVSASFVYRGPSPASEPEVQASINLLEMVDFAFMVNYHSAGELILYGTGSQVDTLLPDDIINIAIAGDDATPAIPGFDPDLSAELYITNGDMTDHAGEAYGVLAHTPELATCAAAESYVDDDEYYPGWCNDEGRSGFEFPDDEELVEIEFANQLAYALSMAESADDPDDPESAVGLETADFQLDPFDVSFGDPQTVAVWTKQAFKDHMAHWSVNGGPTQSAELALWGGGERYGGTDVYYGEYRAEVTGFSPGDEVEVWFTAMEVGEPSAAIKGTKGGKSASTGTPTLLTSDSFTFTASDQRGGDVLLVEDTSPGTPIGGEPFGTYASYFADALAANGYTMDVVEVPGAGPVPHHLGVLGHYDAVIWHEGDKLVTNYQGGLSTTLATHEMMVTMRDYLNEGGKIIASGKNHGFEEFFPLDYGENGHPEEVCHDDCLLLTDDFYQYWFGGFSRIRRGGLGEDLNALDVKGIASPLDGVTFNLDGGDSANNQGSSDGTNGVGTGTATWVTTSSQLPPDEFPWFASSRAAAWDVGGAGSPYEPITGDWQLATGHDDQAYKRLTTVVDMTGATTGSVTFKASYRIEGDWDYFFVEARPVGSDDWTTLPDANGHTQTGTGDSCASGWQDQLHPQLLHYLDADGACGSTGTTGSWHATTATSDGVETWSVDLSPYAGQQVEVHLSYVTDWGTGDLGVFVDDLDVVVDGATVSTTSFESDLGAWAVTGAPADSIQTNPGDWERVGITVELASVVTTDDTVLLGFGLEGVTTAAERADMMGRFMAHLLGG